MEKKEQSRKLNFLDVTVINTGAGKCNHKCSNKTTFIR